MEKVDVFPTAISSSVKELVLPQFKQINESHAIHPFIPYIKNSKVYYCVKEFDEPHSNHFKTLGDQIQKFVLTKAYDCKSIDFVRSKLKHSISSDFRKNIDTRTSFMYNKNYFIVKSCYTFGVRKVLPGTNHILQTTNAYLAFYFIPSHKKYKSKHIVEKTFSAEEVRRFEYRKLKPRSCYRIPSGTVYLFYTTAKTMFSLHIVPEDLKLKLKSINPLIRVTEVKEDVYETPIKTPYIEDASREPTLTLSFQDVDRELMPPPSQPVQKTDHQMNIESDATDRTVNNDSTPNVIETDTREEDRTLNSTPNVIYMIVPQTTPAPPDFVKYYQTLKNQTYGASKELISMDEGKDIQMEPLDLKIKNFDEINFDFLFQDNVNVNVNEIEYNNLVRELDIY